MTKHAWKVFPAFVHLPHKNCYRHRILHGLRVLAFDVYMLANVGVGVKLYQADKFSWDEKVKILEQTIATPCKSVLSAVDFLIAI